MTNLPVENECPNCERLRAELAAVRAELAALQTHVKVLMAQVEKLTAKLAAARHPVSAKPWFGKPVSEIISSISILGSFDFRLQHAALAAKEKNKKYLKNCWPLGVNYIEYSR